MRVYADVYDLAGTTRLGGGPVQLLSASVTRALDGAGRVSVTVPGTDSRAISLLTNKRRLRIYWYDPMVRTIRELGRGVIDQVNAADSGGGWTLSADGPDDIQALQNKNVLLRRIYKGITLPTVLSQLGALAGWTITTSMVSPPDVYARFDGESVLVALIRLCEQYGLHFRAGATANSIEVGTFGDVSNLKAIHLEHAEIGNPGIYNRSDLALISSFGLKSSSNDLYNVLFPVGAGEGEAMLTLEKSNRTTPTYPYAIQSVTGPDGRLVYYIADSTSVSTYGQVEKLGSFKDIAPLSNTDLDTVAAANALYDASVAWLQRHKDKLETYSLTLRGVRQQLKAGQKMRTIYKGRIYRDGEAVTYRDINADLWVMGVTESVSASGISTNLTVATVDRHEMDAAEVIIGTIEGLVLNNMKVKPYPSTRSYVYARELAPSYHAVIPVKITDSTLAIQRIVVTINTSPFRITAQGAAAGGDHDHVMFGLNYSAPFAGGPYPGYAKDGGGSLIGISIAASVAPNNDIRTFGASGNHTHAPVYGITDDTINPQTISIYVDGIDRTSALGGPFAPTNAPATINIDPGLLTGYIVNAAGGMRQRHTIEVRAGAGRGRIEAEVEIYEIVQAINLL